MTCADSAVAATVVRLLEDALAEVDAGDGRIGEISVALVSAGVGDIVLVHAGEAIGVVKR